MIESNNDLRQPFSILLVEDDHDFRDSCMRWLNRKGLDVSGAASGAEALDMCGKQQFDVGLFDMDMPGMSGIELLQRLRGDNNEMETVILTGQGSIESAVQSMKLGASDFLTKPCPLADLEHHLRLAFSRGKLRKENRQLKAILSRSQSTTEIIGESPAMQSVKQILARIASSDRPVLITGESGTGKEVFARAIQQRSPLSDKPFVTINCAALPEQLVESELFGHQKGSFTGATEEKQGLFEVADGGTLFIDELGELPLTVQPKLLRVLEDGSMRRIGSSKQLRVNVRIITATNRDLAWQVKQGEFREDLFYRVNVLPIHLPPLRERRHDIERLVEHFLPRDWRVEDDALAAMTNYAWPGNVRELINVIQRATILADDNKITMSDLPRELLSSPDPSSSRPTVGMQGSLDASQSDDYVGDSLEDYTRVRVLQVLREEKGNKSRAARRLGIHRRKLYRLLERFEGKPTT